MAHASAPHGRVTRGTTGTNRLRRVDRWIAQLPAFRHAPRPLVVDLGYGATPHTTVELLNRLRERRPDVEVVGIEIDPERVARAHEAERPGLSFRLGGFEIPTHRRPDVIRALNVLRQYDETEVPAAWALMQARLAPGGAIVEGTCSENGRVGAWVTLDEHGPQVLTIALHLGSLESPSIAAERLPKALIHHNVPGEPVHRFISDLDRLWAVNAGLGVYGPRQRWIAAVESLRAAGWPVIGTRARWRLGEVSVDWAAVAPTGGAGGPV